MNAMPPILAMNCHDSADFDLVFTYRRIWSPQLGKEKTFGGITFTEPVPGNISMQNWTWGNDYRPGTGKDNFIYTREQLQELGQLSPGDGWEDYAPKPSRGRRTRHFLLLLASRRDHRFPVRGRGKSSPFE
jgi:hypothetical protein